MNTVYEFLCLLTTQPYRISNWHGQTWFGMRVLAWAFVGSVGFLAFAGLEYLLGGPLLTPYLYRPVEVALTGVFGHACLLLIAHIAVVLAFEQWVQHDVSIGWAFAASAVMLVVLAFMSASAGTLWLWSVAVLWALNYPLRILNWLTPRT